MSIRLMVTAKEMAAILSVPVSWIYQRTMLGPEAIPHVKFGKYVRFYPDEVVKFFQDRKVLDNDRSK